MSGSILLENVSLPIPTVPPLVLGDLLELVLLGRQVGESGAWQPPIMLAVDNCREKGRASCKPELVSADVVEEDLEPIAGRRRTLIVLGLWRAMPLVE